MAKRKQINEPVINSKLIPIYIMSAVVPLIVYMKLIILDGILYSTWKGYRNFGDFFNYYKALGIILTACIGLIILLMNRKRYQIDLKRETQFIPAAIYLFFIILSTVLSEYISVSVYGFTERYEGMMVLIAYIFICFYTASVVKKEDELKNVLIFLGTSCLVVGVIGVFQYFGLDIFQTEWGMKLILPSAYHDQAEKMKFEFSGKIIYGTLYNPNFVGSYSSMLLLVSLGLYYYIKNIKHKIAIGVLFCGSAFILWIGSMSRAGLVGGILGIIVLLVLQFKNVIRNWKYSAAIFLYFAVLYLALNGFSGGRVIQELDNINPLKENERLVEQSEQLYVKEVKTENGGIVVRTNTEEFWVQKENEEIVFYDGDNKKLESVFDEGIYSFSEEEYSKYRLLVVEYGVDYILEISGKKLNLKYTDQGFMRLTPAGDTTEIKNAERLALFDGREAFGSGRGFIWSRTIPMIKNTILKGYGPDTYAIYFPQWDVAGKINGLNDPGEVVDKPHNWYMQIAVNTGLLSLFAVIAFIFIYLIKTLIILFKSKERQELILQSAVFSAIISYCMAGFFNDSVVSVAPVFWVLLGLGIAMNKTYRTGTFNHKKRQKSIQ